MATSTTSTEHYKDGDKVAEGDCMRIGSRVHRVVGFKAYPDLHRVAPGHTGRIAVFDTGVEMTLIDGHPVRVAAA